MSNKKPSKNQSQPDIISMISQIKDWRVLLLVVIVMLILVWLNPSGYNLGPSDGAATPETATQTAPDNQATAVPGKPTKVPNRPTAVPGKLMEGVQFFTTTASLVYPDKADARTPPLLYQTFLNDINAAQTSVDIAVFDIDLPELGKALLAANKRGVAVRVAYDDENLTDSRVAALIGSLQDAKIPVKADGREPFMHEKIAVIDQQIVWTGSWNMTINDTYRNNNQSWRFVNPTMAADYTTEIDQLMAGNFGVDKTSNAPHPTIPLADGQLTYYFSPKDGINKYVVDALKKAQKRIVFMAFSYTDKAISQAMIDAHKRGLDVQGVMEAQNAKGTGAAFDALSKGGVDILQDGNCYIMHHKTIIIDDKLVITGSYNFTKSAEQANDENLMMIQSPTLAAQVLAEYALVRQQAEQPTTCGR